MFVIYHKDTHQLFNAGRRDVFATERAAKGIKTRNNLGDEWIISDESAFYKIEKMVTVTNCLTGKPVQIRASERGNPALDPSYEHYHCM